MANIAIGCCLFSAVFLALCFDARAQAPATCDRNCPCTFVPVCGTDGITYSSECTIRVANCDRPLQVTVRSTGVCTGRGGHGGHGGRGGGGDDGGDRGGDRGGNRGGDRGGRGG